MAQLLFLFLKTSWCREGNLGLRSTVDTTPAGPLDIMCKLNLFYLEPWRGPLGHNKHTDRWMTCIINQGYSLKDSWGKWVRSHQLNYPQLETIYWERQVALASLPLFQEGEALPYARFAQRDIIIITHIWYKELSLVGDNWSPNLSTLCNKALLLSREEHHYF